ncbi:MAG: hypothetical protein JWQ40_4525 [Segetibacter sp.]|jgi:hypothetical protein|nr:hypothetical protein [Segetibacter sp.]
MRRIYSLSLIMLLGTCLISSCDTIKNLPTNTTGGLFSLNGTWRLSSTTDGNSMVGTTITVYPLVGNAAIKTLANNSYCARENDQIWKSVKGNGAGGFTVKALVSACNGATIYNDGTVAVVNNEKITVTTRTATNSELVQAWDRVKQQ